ncbi:MAG TPA: phosphoenolpyruvate carboxykinase [Candidatus Polarisedimenticolia bacterium]|nr:phosphoenolpyruvate carboxykinase [Candidatus Polarisedimenticolia bacterium]
MRAASRKSLPVEPRTVIENPSDEELKRLTAAMPTARLTRFGNYNVATKVTARSKGSTYVVTDEPSAHSDQTLSRREGERVAGLQDAYIREREMLVVEGFIGNAPDFRVAARLIMEKSNANIAGMQKMLYFPASASELASFSPEVTVVYTPGLAAQGFPNDRLIAVDLDRMVTRVFNSDYFGESKKGGLRMWNKIVHDRGGLALHAGCKIIPTDRGPRVGLIVGLSGTGKTTTTFTRQNESRPVQDDFAALMPGGKVHATENGCFAKTFGLDPRFEPTIHKAVCQPRAYLENVSQKGEDVDFFDTSYTQNGRAVFPMSEVDGAADAREIDKAHFLLILNANENIIPGVARLTGAAAAAFFMLGETKGTSAGGAEEAGKSLRVPGTNPFFPLLHAEQGNRFLDLLGSDPLEVYLMNTGRVGGPSDDPRSRKVKIPHSSAIVEAIAEGTIVWDRDPDFGYEVARHVPGIGPEDEALLRPRELYEAQGRTDEYRGLVETYRREREQYLRRWPGLRPEIVQAGCRPA